MILIGLPIYKRAWILPTWLAAIEKQTIPLSELGFIFEFGPDDSETKDALFEWHALHPEVSVFDGATHEENHRHHEERHRTWRQDDYMKMANLRNHLLERAIAIQPDAYYSLDSDIILENPKTIETLFELTERCDAVSTLSHMWPSGNRFPSVMYWDKTPGGQARRNRYRHNMGTLFQADVIMASVMMSPKVYNTVKYRFHKLGEDLGWSYNAYLAGFKLWCASYLYTPHVMHRYMLESFLEKGDPRSPVS